MGNVIDMFQGEHKMAVCPECWADKWIVVLNGEDEICGFLCEKCKTLWEAEEDEYVVL